MEIGELQHELKELINRYDGSSTRMGRALYNCYRNIEEHQKLRSAVLTMLANIEGPQLLGHQLTLNNFLEAKENLRKVYYHE